MQRIILEIAETDNESVVTHELKGNAAIVSIGGGEGGNAAVIWDDDEDIIKIIVSLLSAMKQACPEQLAVAIRLFADGCTYETKKVEEWKNGKNILS